ncbi:PTS glucose transporter subunit IIA [Flexivirga sp. ID2601S]|uniref:PTS glucose transporter subunit IIA n=1 Tax=Flexivirga aerilata TaxID=1656889 RepID=A0A849AEX8_9MICO|nr:PTS glucose transporter subunit IIA [Flexivirga aerilata]
MTTPPLLCPYDGSTVPLADVPDPVLAQGILGGSVALEPERHPGVALAPVGGRVHTRHPHALIIRPADAPATLLHLGVDTVHLQGDGFRSLAEVGDVVAAGDPVVEWDPGFVIEHGLSPVVVVALLDTPPGALAVRPGRYRAGDPLVVSEPGAS